MPDFFTPVVVLCLFLLGFGETRLGRLETASTALIAAIGIAAHLSHLPSALALVVLLPLLRRSWRPLLRVAPPVAAAMLFLVGANWQA
jgi:predicted exporter